MLDISNGKHIYRDEMLNSALNAYKAHWTQDGGKGQQSLNFVHVRLTALSHSMFWAATPSDEYAITRILNCGSYPQVEVNTRSQWGFRFDPGCLQSRGVDWYQFSMMLLRPKCIIISAPEWLK